jgi:surfactin synthase thioesterase subunit
LFKAKNGKVFSEELLKPWKKYSGNGFVLHTIPGRHLFIHQKQSREKLLGHIIENMI